MLTKFLDWVAEPPERSVRRRPRTEGEKWLIGVLVFTGTVFGGQALLAGMSEGYCLIWPGIGTRFAPSYSVRRFESVKPGMTKAEVERILKRPLAIQNWCASSGKAQWQPGDETWQYASDGSFLGGDWAWLSREVVFRKGIVVQRVYWTYHD